MSYICIQDFRDNIDEVDCNVAVRFSGNIELNTVINQLY